METTMPIWVTVALSLIGTLGGFELIKYLINVRSNHRKGVAIANQEAAKAGQEDRMKQFSEAAQNYGLAKTVEVSGRDLRAIGPILKVFDVTTENK